jgi:hypothetical protein
MDFYFQSVTRSHVSDETLTYWLDVTLGYHASEGTLITSGMLPNGVMSVTKH